MPTKNKPTWIAVMDGTQARFFSLHRGEDGQIFEEVANPVAKRAAGRSGKPGRGKTSSAGRRGMNVDAQKTDTTRYSREVAGALDGALADKRYDQLVLVAPPRILAELREYLSTRVRETLAHQVPKNFMKLTTDTLWEKLSLILLKAARPVNGSASRVATVSGNSLPVSVVFRNMEPSASVQAQAVKYAAKLGRKYGRIQNCRVMVDAPKHAHRKVKEFRVAIDLKLPHHEIATKSASSDGAAYDDLNTALREAFATATRQLQDHAKKVKSGTLRERRQASPKLRGYAEA